MIDNFSCPECDKHYSIAELELWEVYKEDGAQTEFDCTGCGAELIINSSVDSWSFDAEVNE